MNNTFESIDALVASIAKRSRQLINYSMPDLRSQAASYKLETLSRGEMTQAILMREYNSVSVITQAEREGLDRVIEASKKRHKDAMKQAQANAKQMIIIEGDQP